MSRDRNVSWSAVEPIYATREQAWAFVAGGSRKVFEELVADEEGHSDMFDQQIQYIERFGERFLALQSLEAETQGD